ANGKVVGLTTSGNIGYTVGKSLVLGYVPVKAINQGDYSVISIGNISNATLVKGAAYDASRTKILA
ncbi:MAG: glycine cleavage T C-terminal barrel domain-containing protein, partial [Paracoccaceae bacterium]